LITAEQFDGNSNALAERCVLTLHKDHLIFMVVAQTVKKFHVTNVAKFMEKFGFHPPKTSVFKNASIL